MLGRFHGFLMGSAPNGSAAKKALFKERRNWPAPPEPVVIAHPEPAVLGAVAPTALEFNMGVDILCNEIRQRFDEMFMATTFEWDVRAESEYLYCVGADGKRMNVLEVKSGSASENIDIKVLCYYQNKTLQCSEVIDHAITFVPNSQTQDLWTGKCMFVDFDSKRVISVSGTNYEDTKNTILAMLVSTFNPNPAPNEPALVPWP